MAVRTLFWGTFLILLVAALTVESESVYHKLEDALTSEQTVLHQMQEAFFPAKGSSRDVVYFNVCVTIGSVQPESCDNSFFKLHSGQSNFTYCQKFQWSSSALLDLISSDQLLIFDNVISENIIHVIEHQQYMAVPLQIDTFPCDFTVDDILTALMQLLPWVKSYARVHGQSNENDKGYVSISYHKYVTGSYQGSDTNADFYRITVLCAFIFLNILTPVALAKSVSVYYSKARTKSSSGEFVGCFYWATAFVTLLFNTLYMAASVARPFILNRPVITSCILSISDHTCKIPSDTSVYKDEVLTVVGKFTIIPIAICIELVVSIHAENYHFTGQRRLRGSTKCCSWKQLLMQIVHVLALWNILVAIQICIMIAIPISVLLWIRPQLTIIYAILWLMIPVSLTIIVAYLLYQCQQPIKKRVCCNAKRCGRNCVQLLVIIAILALIVTLLVLYELILQVQVEAGSGLRGIVLTLLPSFPLSALGWYLKRRSQKKAKKSDDNEFWQLNVEENQSEDIRTLPV